MSDLTAVPAWRPVPWSCYRGGLGVLAAAPGLTAPWWRRHGRTARPARPTMVDTVTDQSDGKMPVTFA